MDNMQLSIGLQSEHRTVVKRAWPEPGGGEGERAGKTGVVGGLTIHFIHWGMAVAWP